MSTPTLPPATLRDAPRAARRAWPLHALALAAACCAAPALAGDVRFTVTTQALPTLPSNNLPQSVFVSGINSSGHVSGTVIYQNGRTVGFGLYGNLYVPFDSYATITSAVGIAEDGTVFGGRTLTNGDEQAFFYKALQITPLNQAGAHRAAAMDPTGARVGVVRLSNGDLLLGPASGGLGTLDNCCQLYAINRHGAAIGASLSGSFIHAADGTRRNFSLAGGWLRAINSAGVAVGNAGGSDNGWVRIDPTDNVAQLMGKPAGWTTATAMSINDRGVIVGRGTPGSGQTAAIVDPRNSMRALSELTTGTAGMRLFDAAAVNEHGQIAGMAVDNTTNRPMIYLATPTGTLRWDGGGSGSFLDGARWDSGAGLAPGKFLDAVIAPAGNTTVLANESASMKSLTVGAASGGATAVLRLADGARLAATASPITIEARGQLVGNGSIGGDLVNRGTLLGTSALPLALTVEGDIDNTGLISGRGVIAGGLINRSGPGVRVEGGEALQLVGPIHTNADAGRIEVRGGGALAFSGQLVNQGGAFIRIDNGTLRTGSLENGGLVQIAFGGASFFGDVVNAAATDPNRGRIVASGGASVTFWDRVQNQGEIRASAGSRLLYFRAVTGTGSFTTNGGGFHRFEGGFSPTATGAPNALRSGGFEAAAFGITELGDVEFASTLSMALGGLVPGSGHDQIVFTGSVLFDVGSRLAVSLVDGFAPAGGQSFQLFRYTGSAPQGQFDGFDLPMLAAELMWDTSAIYSSGVLSVTAVPEPESWALMVAGMAAMGSWMQRRRSRAG
jgi:hypothetical protein